MFCLATLLCVAATGRVDGVLSWSGFADPEIRVGYYGATARSEPVANFVGVTTGANRTEAWCTTYSPRDSRVTHASGNKATFSHVSLPSGKYVFFAMLNGTFLSYKKVDLAAGKSLTLNLTADRKNLGSLVVSVPSVSQAEVELTPCAPDGKPLLPVAPDYGVCITKDTVNGKAVFASLNAGTYDVELLSYQQVGRTATSDARVLKSVGKWRVTVQKGLRTDIVLPPKR